MKLFDSLLVFFPLCIVTVYADFPCVPRFFNESSVCVCNSTYCDTVTREVPQYGNYIKYTSSKSGKRFSKTQGLIQISSLDNDVSLYGLVLEIQPERLYQTIEGFGGAVTDAAGINWKSLPPGAQQHLVNSYFSAEGLEYNMIRLPIGSTDFSTRSYAYNEYPINDTTLSNFTFVPEDIKYKLPMINESMKVATDEIEVVSTSWSPPNWMMSSLNDSRTIIEEFYQTYADYFCKFAQLYHGEGIKIWGVSAANEPIDAFFNALKNESTGWTATQMAEFIIGYFGPTIRNCSVEGIKILANDDQRFSIPLWFSLLAEEESEFAQYIDGIAVHYYADTIIPGAILSRSIKDYPDKFIISTEACEGSFETLKVDLGSWTRAKSYILDILEDLNYNVVGWLDWNMCLDLEGGPNWLANFVDSPIIVNAEKKEFYKQPMYYAFGHFAKFIPRGSNRTRVVKKFPAPDPNLDLQDLEQMGQEYFDNVAFLTPRGTVVVVIHNNGSSVPTAIQIGNQQITTTLDDESITTIEFPFCENNLNGCQ